MLSEDVKNGFLQIYFYPLRILLKTMEEHSLQWHEWLFAILAPQCILLSPILLLPFLQIRRCRVKRIEKLKDAK